MTRTPGSGFPLMSFDGAYISRGLPRSQTPPAASRRDGFPTGENGSTTQKHTLLGLKSFWPQGGHPGG